MGLRVLRVSPETLMSLLAMLPRGMIVGSVPSERSVGLVLHGPWPDHRDPGEIGPGVPIPEIMGIVAIDMDGEKVQTTLSLPEYPPPSSDG